MGTNPWDMMRELSALQERMNRIWNDVYDRGPVGRDDETTRRGSWVPPVDIYEGPDRSIVLKAELPGLRREDIDITVENTTLTINGQRPMEEGIAEGQYHRIERRYGSFSRSFTLPATVDASAVRAEYRDGVLTVTLPVRGDARPRQIQVELNS